MPDRGNRTDPNKIDLAVLAAVGRREVRGEAGDWWYVGEPDPALSAAKIEPGFRVTGRIRRLMRHDLVEVAEPPAASRTLAKPTEHGRAVLTAHGLPVREEAPTW